MEPTLYRQTVVGYIKGLRNLSAMLEQATRFCEEKGTSTKELLKFQLHTGHKGVLHNVQIATNVAKLSVERITRSDVIVFADDETTMAEAQQRIQRTLEVLEAVDPASMAGREDEPLLMRTRSLGDVQFESGQRYVAEYAVPFFHHQLTTAFHTLCHLGVPIDIKWYMNGYIWEARDMLGK